jgi:uncharacterized protein
MLFRRRNNPSFRERVGAIFRPPMPASRILRYYARRILRLKATPHAVAMGVGAGVFASFTPFLGFHFAIAAVLAWLLRGNLVASALATFVGNPVTFPLIWGATLELGRYLEAGTSPGGSAGENLSHMLRHLEIAELWAPVLKPMLIGSVPLGLAFAGVAYVATLWATAAFQLRRRQRMEQHVRRHSAQRTALAG